MSKPQLAMVEKETWTREFIVERNGALLGSTLWDIEFALFALEDRTLPIFTCTKANGRAKWLAPGVVRVTVPKASVDKFEFDSVGFYLRVIDLADTEEDPQGNSVVCLRGILDYYPAIQQDAKGMRVY